MERTRKVLQRNRDADDGFIFICGKGVDYTEVVGCWLELHFVLDESEFWAYAKQFPAGRNRDAVKDDLRLTLLRGRGEIRCVRVAIRPKDADAKYGTTNVDRVAEFVERDFRNLLQSS